MKKSIFDHMVEKAFLSVETRGGLKKGDAQFKDRTATVRFQNGTTEITLIYEIGVMPWLEISELNNPSNKSTLGWLLVEAGVENPPLPEQAFLPTKIKESELEPILQKMSVQLLEYGTGLLKGDFTIMPKLQERARRYSLECDRYLSIRKPKP